MMRRAFILHLLCIVGLGLHSVQSQGFDCETGDLPDDERRDCHPEPDSNEQACRARNCTWCPAHNPGNPAIPWCFFPPDQSAGKYVMLGDPIAIGNGFRVNLQRSDSPPSWEGEAQFLTLTAQFQSNYRLHVKITNDADPNRWQVPLEIFPASGTPTNPLYEITFVNNPTFSFKVVRRSSGATLFQSDPSQQFIFANQYVTLSWSLGGNANVYGIGENEQPTFKHDFSQNRRWALWARDHVPDFTTNIYGTQPHYTVLENDGNAHAVVLVNSNAQEWGMLNGPMIRYKSTGGILDFYFFLGPTPENTVQQYTEAVGRAQMPPYWALGFQLCRYGYNNIANMRAAVDRTAQWEIPHDVQYGDIDIMERALDFTYSQTNFPGLPDYIRELKQRGIKFMTILDPAISIGEPQGTYPAFERGQQMDVWVKRPNGSPVTGRVWPQDPTYFPDYTKNSTREWWIDLIREFHGLLEYDGLWIDMNEPANFVTGDIEGCAGNQWNNPPFMPAIRDGNLATMTICADSVHQLGRHYDVHSLYGWSQSEPTLVGTRAGTGKRALVLSRSTFLGSGRWVAHWLGDNFSRWSNLHFSIIGMLQFNLFGIPFVGADICGFNEPTTAEMCQRWMQLGAFYPFARNHNGFGQPDQDPGYFGAEVAGSSKAVLEVRYTLLPYLYTLFYLHRTTGSTVVRAMWHEFPRDSIASTIDTQFFWGSGLLISPVLQEGVTDVTAYFPDARFFNYFDGVEVEARNGTLRLPAPRSTIPLHLKGGNILPIQEPARNTELSRNNPMGLIVALNDARQAEGSLFYDDGDSIDTIENGNHFYARYSVTNRMLTTTIERNGWPEMSQKVMNTVYIYGSGGATRVYVNGVEWWDWVNLPSGAVFINNLGLAANSAFTISF